MLKHFFTPWLLASCLVFAFASEFYVGKVLLENVRKHYGDKAGKRMVAWQNLLDSSRGLSEAEKLKKVNQFFNQLRFISDLRHWGEEDFWATPVEFLASGGGDCEDFSIAKYFTLRELGVADEKLRITYVKALKLNQAHMVLSYYPKPGAEPLILDNLEGEILKASVRRDLKPVYNFNGDGLWLARQRGKGVRVGKADRISLWMELRKRLRLSVEQGATGKPGAGKKP
ncbi:transglutaminase-like cysteine peptidase [Endozoicomonas arenosclerae]|uniref:transglutaminase-like cysteine peptidase n=1 Tax=Endozoicomonas arenosclerae TaxID=1633495 RepID=UPI000782E85F|nr:transglutaminase-like cysteine peptidase [Endozoicomonas arenosclerae]